jgi:hypothetical protein
MKIKKVIIGGNREEINRTNGEHVPNLIDGVQYNDLIFTPELLIKKLFKKNNLEYENWLKKHQLHPSQINHYNINQKQELLEWLKIYTEKLLTEAKTDPLFYSELGNLNIKKWLETFNILENHIYDLNDFEKTEFIKIVDAFKKRFTTSSPFAFLTVDDINQQIKVVESHKVLLLLNRKLPMGKKRGTPVGQEPNKIYQNFFTTIGYKGKGELTEGLNYHRTNFKNFNFNLNIEIRLLHDIIYEILKYNKLEIQIAFIFGIYGKKPYFESDIKGTERTKEERDAIDILENITKSIEKKLHKERQGSIAVDKTSIEVNKRIKYPKISNMQNTKMPQVQTDTTHVAMTQSDILISKSLKDFEKELLKRQKGYAELAKEKINLALTDKEKYIEEFYNFLEKGMSISDALNKFSQRYANNPYIKGIIETSITGELQLQALKNRGINELTDNINLLNYKIQILKEDLGKKETEIALLNQTIESTIVSHTRQLEEIEININQLIEERDKLIDNCNKKTEIIQGLDKLIIQYEETIKNKNNEIKKLNHLIVKLNHRINILEGDKELLSKKIEHYSSETRLYLKQIEQLKEENKLIISTTDLLKMSNKQLENQLIFLTKTNETLTSKNIEYERNNNLLTAENKILKDKLINLEKTKK